METHGLAFTAIKATDADSYDRRAREFDDLTVRFSTDIAAHMLRLAGLSSEGSLLDLGTGTGLLAILAAKQCNTVVAVDHSAGMLAEARASADRAGLSSQISFEAMDAEALKLAPGTFDAVVSLFVIRHLPNPTLAVQEIFRVLKPGGRAVISTGARPDLMTRQGLGAAFEIAYDRIMEKAGRKALSPTFLRRFLAEQGVPASNHHAAHAATGDVGQMLKAAGFAQVRRDWWTERHELTPELFWEVQAVFDSEARTALSALPADDTERLRESFLKRVRQLADRGATLVYRTGVFIYTARK